MRFNAYEAEDFLQEQSFLNYCISANEEDVRFWNKWLSEHPDRAQAVNQGKELYYLLNGNITAKDFTADEQHFIEAFDTHTGSSRVVAAKRRSIWTYVGAAAACLAGAFFIYNYNNVTPKSANVPPVKAYAMPNASTEKKPLTLPDGSEVTLNSGSVIRLADNFNGTSRELTLEGEAYFDVAHDAGKPFIIHTATMDVKVLGTRFNVKAYSGDRESETSLISGSVEITLQKNKKKIILTPNHKVTLLNDESRILSKDSSAFHVTPMTARAADQADELSWTKNKLVFRNSTFEDISHEIERWYDVRLVFEDEVVRNFRYSATFEDKDIDEVLAALQLSRPFRFTKNNAKLIRISSQQ